MAARPDPAPAATVQVPRALQGPVPVFIVHHGKRPQDDQVAGGLDCMKRIALDIKRQLQEHSQQPVPTFVDEIDLEKMGLADDRMREALFNCKVAVVLFCDDFFTSSWCTKEVTMVVTHAANQRFDYLPVFFYTTVDELKEQARKAGKDDQFIEQLLNEHVMVRTTGIRHKGERVDGINKDTQTTINEISDTVRERVYRSVPAQDRAPWAAVSTAKTTLMTAVSAAVAFMAAPLLQAMSGPVDATDLGSALAGSNFSQWLSPVASYVFTATSVSLLLQLGAAAAVASGIASTKPHSRIATCGGCVTALVQVPADSGHGPEQLHKWVQELSQQLHAAQPELPGPRVVAVCGDGGLVAWCQQGWGVWLHPHADGLPRLQIKQRVLPNTTAQKGSDCTSKQPVSLDVTWQGPLSPNSRLLVKQGGQLHAQEVGVAAAVGSSTAASSSSSPVDFRLPDMFPDEGLLLLSASTGQYYSSTPEPVLVLDVDAETAAELNAMAGAEQSLKINHGWETLSCLHILLLQPDSDIMQLPDFSDNRGIIPSEGAPESEVYTQLQQPDILSAVRADLDCWLQPKRLMDIITNMRTRIQRAWLDADEGQAEVSGLWETPQYLVQTVQQAAGAATDNLGQIRVAAVRAMAAYVLLEVAIREKRLLVVRWLLSRLKQQRAWREEGHCTAEAVLVAQQRLAWSGRTHRSQLQVPLLLLADKYPDRAIYQELADWSKYNKLPSSIGPLAAATHGAKGVDMSLTMDAITIGLMGGGVGSYPAHRRRRGSTRLDTANENDDAQQKEGWDAPSPNVLSAASVHQLAAVLGPEGDLPVAVLSGSFSAVEGVLTGSTCSQQHLDEALEIAALLGSSRLSALELLLKHGANPLARGGAALTWAAQRKGEPEVLQALKAAVEQQPHTSSDSYSSTTDDSGQHYSLAVAAWCMGLQQELLALRDPAAPEPGLKSVQQFLDKTVSTTQCTVDAPLSELQQEWPELFPGGLPAGVSRGQPWWLGLREKAIHIRFCRHAIP